MVGLSFLSLAGCGQDKPSASSQSQGEEGSLGGDQTSLALKATSVSDREVDASRLAMQATFGGTPALISRIASLGTSAWLDEQFEATGSTYADMAKPVPSNQGCAAGIAASACSTHWFTRQPVAMRFYADALSQPDQLRQRVALALSQLIVVSTEAVPHSDGAAAFNQIFLANAFGNYRDVLMQASMSSFMGLYLNMAGSNRTAPSENYAREFLQLFTMGPDKLNMDGSAITDATGASMPNYTPEDIKNVARALTGWIIPRQPTSADNDYTAAMIQSPSRYDSAAKTFLGTTVPAGTSQAKSVEAVIDAAFNNASTPPYISKYLISQLVTPNPTPAYVARIAAVFVNNGRNVRGDLKAVVRAILTDSEARVAPTGTSGGKVKEPILFLTGLARASGMTSDGYPFTTRDKSLGQPVFASPSVFGFYPPDFPLPNSATLLSPASKLMTTYNIVLRNNLVYDWTLNYTASAKAVFGVTKSVVDSTGTTVDWSVWEALDVATMVDRLDLLMTNRTLTTAQKAALTAAANAITNADAATQARLRAQALLFLVATSPFFQVDR